MPADNFYEPPKEAAAHTGSGNLARIVRPILVSAVVTFVSLGAILGYRLLTASEMQPYIFFSALLLALFVAAHQNRTAHWGVRLISAVCVTGAWFGVATLEVAWTGVEPPPGVVPITSAIILFLSTVALLFGAPLLTRLYCGSGR
jgi:hypothetical protein